MREPCFRDYTHAAAALELPYFALTSLPLNSYHAQVSVDPEQLCRLLDLALGTALY
jgi:hypothetical protein